MDASHGEAVGNQVLCRAEAKQRANKDGANGAGELGELTSRFQRLGWGAIVGVSSLLFVASCCLYGDILSFGGQCRRGQMGEPRNKLVPDKRYEYVPSLRLMCYEYG